MFFFNCLVSLHKYSPNYLDLRFTMDFLLLTLSKGTMRGIIILVKLGGNGGRG